MTLLTYHAMILTANYGLESPGARDSPQISIVLLSQAEKATLSPQKRQLGLILWSRCSPIEHDLPNWKWQHFYKSCFQNVNIQALVWEDCGVKMKNTHNKLFIAEVVINDTIKRSTKREHDLPWAWDWGWEGCPSYLDAADASLQRFGTHKTRISAKICLCTNRIILNSILIRIWKPSNLPQEIGASVTLKYMYWYSWYSV